MNTKLLSIIVAVYNVQPYLVQCIESLCQQTYKNLEIILINDGSTDKSGMICDEYAAKDARITVIHQDNQGQSCARNAALNIMHGEYFTVVDSDDYVLPEVFEICMNNIEQYQLDCFSFGSFRKGKGYGGSGKITLSLEDEQVKRLAYCLANEGALPWGYVMRSSLWADLRYPPGRYFEDDTVAHHFWAKVKRSGHIDTAFYYYRKNMNGTCQTTIFKPKARYDYILACLDRLAFAEEKKLCVAEARSAVIKSVLSYLTSFYAVNATVDDRYREAVKVLCQQRELPYDDNLLNGKYKMFLWCFGRADFIHKISAKLSLTSKKLSNFVKAGS